MALTKSHLIDAIYKSHDVTQAQARDIVEAFLKISKDSLLGGDDLLISGFENSRRKKKRSAGEGILKQVRI